MPFEMETSRTADAAKLAVLWRDRGGGSGGGNLNEVIRSILSGAQTGAVANGDFVKAPTRFTGTDKLSLYQTVYRGFDGFGGPDLIGAFNQTAQNGVGLKSILAMVIDLRQAIRGVDGGVSLTNQPIADGLDVEVFRGNVVETLRYMQEHIERQEEAIDDLKARVRSLERAS